MDKKQASRLLRPLRGTHVFIMMAYLMIQTSLTVEELRDCTGLSDDVLRPALKYLEGEGYLCKQIGEHGKVNWLPVGSSFLGQLFQSPRLSDSGHGVVVVVESEERNNLYSTSTTNKRQSPRLSDSGLNAEELLNLAALKAAGVVGKKARELAQLPWVNVEYIEAHAAQVKSEMFDNPPGMMVYRIEGEVPAPEVISAGQEYHVRTVDRGKRGKETFSFTWDVDQEIADYMGHEKGCSCGECRWIIAHNGMLESVCPDCKHHECECE